MSPSAPTEAPPQVRRRRRSLKVVLALLGALLLVLVTGGLWAVNTYGPRFGVHLTPPSPEEYADIALDHLQNGYYATGPEWEAARVALEEAAASAEDHADLHDEIEAAASVAGGDHSFFLTPREAEEYAGDSVSDFEAPSVTSADGITTVTVPPLGDVSADLQQEYAQAAADGIAAAASQTCGWIVDVRGNTGGDMYPMLAGLSALLPNGTAFELVARGGHATTITIQDDGVRPSGGITGVGERQKVTGAPIAVLQDDMTASSGEAVLTAFRGLDDVESFGGPSAGYTSGNAVHRLYDGAMLAMTVSVYVDRDGVNLNEEPIQPNHTSPAKETEGAALEWVSRHGCAE